jgi:hypothetical protein
MICQCLSWLEQLSFGLSIAALAINGLLLTEASRIISAQRAKRCFSPEISKVEVILKGFATELQ